MLEYASLNLCNYLKNMTFEMKFHFKEQKIVCGCQIWRVLGMVCKQSLYFVRNYLTRMELYEEALSKL